MIQFNEIPINLLTPGQFVEFDNSKAIRGLVNQPQRLLVIAPMLAAGTATANTPFQLTRAVDGINKLGRGSMGAAMMNALFNVTDTIETWVLPVADNGAGTAATGTIVVAGTPTEAGTINLYIAAQQIQIGVTTTMTAANIATAINAAINANADLPVTSTVSTATVTVAARHKGTLGNDIDMRVNYYPLSQRTPAGITLTITQLASGSGDPTIATALANTGETQYNHIIMAFSDDTNITSIETALNDRWGPLLQNDGHCHIAKRGSVGTLNTFASSRNNPHVNAWAMEPSGIPNPSWEMAAVAGTTSAYYLAIDPARPLQTLTLKGILPASKEIQFTRSERNNLISYGIATSKVDAGGNVVIERGATMYTLNTAGIVDPSYRDIETMATLSYLRYTVRARISQKYPRHKLADRGTEYQPNMPIATPDDIEGELIALAKDWIDAGLMEDMAQFKRDLRVEIDSNDPNRVNVILPPNIVNQFRIFAAQIQFRL